jgi:transcriptional regulator with XRE-family HTH domain
MALRMTDSSHLSVGQVRQARALLGWSQRDLASHASLAVSTVADFERGYRVPLPNNLEAIRASLEQAGVSFVNGGAILRSEERTPVEPRAGGIPFVSSKRRI